MRSRSNRYRKSTVLAGYDLDGDRTFPFEHFGFVALLDTGPIPGQPKDRLGLSFVYARVSHNLTEVTASARTAEGRSSGRR